MDCNQQISLCELEIGELKTMLARKRDEDNRFLILQTIRAKLRYLFQLKIEEGEQLDQYNSNFEKAVHAFEAQQK